MSREQRVADLIDRWQPRLGLQAWDIRYNPDRKIGKNQGANNTQHNPLKACEVGISPESPDRELEGCVLHELLHIVITPLEEKAQHLAGAMDARASVVFMDEIHDIVEATIEQLVAGLAGQRPMPFGKRMAKHFATFMEAA